MSAQIIHLAKGLAANLPAVRTDDTLYFCTDSRQIYLGQDEYAEYVSTNFIGTLEQWNSLSTAQKDEYDTVDLIDDYNGSSVTNSITQNSVDPVSSGAVYDAVQQLHTSTTWHDET